VKKLSLDIASDVDILLFGLLADVKIHKLAWQLNTFAAHQFVWIEDLILEKKNKVEPLYFPMYTHEDHENHFYFKLVANFAEGGGVLFREFRQFQYFISVSNGLDFFEQSTFLDKLKMTPSIRLVSLIEKPDLIRKINLIM